MIEQTRRPRGQPKKVEIAGNHSIRIKPEIERKLAAYQNQEGIVNFSAAVNKLLESALSIAH